MASAAARRVPRPDTKPLRAVPPPLSDIRELAPPPADNATQELDASQIEEAYELLSQSRPRSAPPPAPPARRSETPPPALARTTARSVAITTAYTLFYFAGSLARRIGRLLAAEWRDARDRARLRATI